MTTCDYIPTPFHWCVQKVINKKETWIAFSNKDSAKLEDSFLNKGPDIIPVQGGRHDVCISARARQPVYWSSTRREVRRCSWFIKVSGKTVPYEESISGFLEEEFKKACETGEWEKDVIINSEGKVVFNNSGSMVHIIGRNVYTVKRDISDLPIEPDEAEQVDHLLFIVLGIGPVVGIRLKPVEVITAFRNIAHRLIETHYQTLYENGVVGRIEILPIVWHEVIHNKDFGIDDKLKAITLDSIPKLRHFANETIVDLLFYTSTFYSQSIINIVAHSMNDVYTTFLKRNPTFKGEVSITGHSLGALILFDLLCHQNSVEGEIDSRFSSQYERIRQRASTNVISQDILSTTKIYPEPGRYTQSTNIIYPQLLFVPRKFFAIGSPIGLFVTIRGLDSLGVEFKLPNCAGFYNIFHPYDPIAYRMEALVNPELTNIKPKVIPHHKGRKRMHLEVIEAAIRIGADIKQLITDTFTRKVAEPKKKEDTQELRRVYSAIGSELKADDIKSEGSDSEISTKTFPFDRKDEISLGALNEFKRIDYVLQETPIEFINEYIFAFTSHICYWDSDDTVLFIIREMYAMSGISPDGLNLPVDESNKPSTSKQPPEK